jgi:hypothetical protein
MTKPKKRRSEIEWVGGLGSMPGYVMGEGEPYRPETLVWMSPSGMILGHAVGKPGELIALAAESLRETIARPAIGPPHAPQRIRVASPELAKALRAALETIEVVCGPTPELDPVFEAMRERMGESPDDGQSWLSEETDPEHVGAFFRAAAALFRAKPWEIVPHDQDVLAVTIESLGIREAALSVVGRLGEVLGFILFFSIEDFEAFLDGADPLEEDEPPRMPRHFVLQFERGAEQPASLRKEIAAHGWEVAGPAAYPWVFVNDEELVSRPATPREVSIAEAISLALTQLMMEREALLAAWDGGPLVERKLLVGTHDGPVEVTLRAPFAQRTMQTVTELLARLAYLDRGDELIDERARGKLEDELMNKFADSPEARALPHLGACDFLLDFAADHFGATLATLGARELKAIVFEIVPQKVNLEPAQAPAIIEEFRALYAFLKREAKLSQADACLRVLGRDAVKKLELALSDSSNFGPAKSVIQAGREAGFDMSTQKGVEAWMQAMSGKPLPPSVRLPPLGPVSDSSAARAKKDKRKATQKARKKNR